MYDTPSTFPLHYLCFLSRVQFSLVSVIVKLSNFTLMHVVAPQQSPETQQVW